MVEIHSTTVSSRGTSTTRDGKTRASAQDNRPAVVPARAATNFIPSPESLATLIESAVAALRQGVRWDRGTMLNLLV